MTAPPSAHARAPLSYIARAVRKMAMWWITGKGSPSPFFDSEGAPSVAPQVLTTDERSALRTIAVTSNR